MPSFSICICTYKRPAGLGRLLAALKPQLGLDREIIVVNDGSHDDAYGKLVDEYGTLMHYIVNISNAGVAETRNTAAKAATGDYILYIDDDCVPPPWWIDWIDARLEENPELDIVVGPARALHPEQGPTFLSRLQAHFGFIPSIHVNNGTILFPTANLALRRGLMQSMGGFGFPGTFHGAGEDTEFANRARLAGARTMVDRNWFVFHDVGEPYLSLARRYGRYGFSNGAMTVLATSPAAHDMIEQMTLPGLRWQWRYYWRKVRREASRYPGPPLERWLALWGALGIHMYYEYSAIRGRDHARMTHPAGHYSGT
jgi:glycosyltransferase involved in cell wall biosynthesis